MKCLPHLVKQCNDCRDMNTQRRLISHWEARYTGCLHLHPVHNEGSSISHFFYPFCNKDAIPTCLDIGNQQRRMIKWFQACFPTDCHSIHKYKSILFHCILMQFYLGLRGWHLSWAQMWGLEYLWHVHNQIWEILPNMKIIQCILLSVHHTNSDSCACDIGYIKSKGTGSRRFLGIGKPKMYEMYCIITTDIVFKYMFHIGAT